MSSAELLYGVPIALPGELVDTAEPPATTFLENLRQPPPVGLPTRPLPSFTPSTGPLQRLMEADFVFVRHGAPGPPLLPLYDGPYRVVAKSPKVFQLQLGSCVESSQWTDSSPVCPQRPSQRFHRGEAVLLFNLQNLSLRPPFWGGPCRGQLILESTGDNPPTAIEKSVEYYYYITV